MPNDTKIDISLDPEKIIQSLADVSEESKNLSTKIEESLGKDAVKSIEKLEDTAEKGSNKISSYFRNLGTRVKEDLKTAFDATGILAGAKFAKELGAGVQQVFEMERAFDRLNTRLGLSVKQLSDFKKEIGRKIAGTGQKLEDVLPGVETAASRGGVKSPEQLTAIGEALGQAKAVTGEGTEQLSESVIEILKSQGKKVTSESFKATLDALEGTRTAGAFKSAGEAGQAIEELSPYAKKLGLNTRELGGLAAQASQSGAGGQNILRQLMEKGTTIGGQQQINALLGQQVFKGGKLNAEALGKVNTERFGQYSQQILGQEMSGANGGDLARFVEAFKGNMGNFKQVVSGSNETATQFDQATDNMASSIDRFKERTKAAGREVGESFSVLGKDLLQGNFGKVGEDIGGAGKALHENKGQVMAAAALTAGVGILAGGSMNRILEKIPGVGTLTGASKGEAAKAAGIEPVYVTNASEIGGAAGSNITDKLGDALGAGGKAGKLATAAGAAGSALKMVGGAAVGLEIGMAIGDALMQVPAIQKGTAAVTDWVSEKLFGSDDDRMKKAEADQMEKSRASYNERKGTNLSPAEYEAMLERAHTKALQRANAGKTTNFSNPSAVTGRGGSM